MNTPDMKKVPARRVAVYTLVEFEDKLPYLDQLGSRQIERFGLGGGEAKLLRNIASGVVRHKNYLNWVAGQLYNGSVKKSDPKFRAILQLAIFEIRFLDFIPPYATVNEYVGMAKKLLGLQASKRVNGVLRSYMRSGKSLNPEKKFKFIESQLSAKYSFPEWLVQRWLDQFGEAHTRSMLEAMNERPEFDLRVNRTKISLSDFKQKLADLGIEHEKSQFFEHFFKIKDVQKIIAKGLFDLGLCSIQDESAFLPVKLLDVQSGQRVLDMCAAPGGKTTAMLEEFGKKIHLFAMDNSPERLQQVINNCKRLGFENGVEFLSADGEHLPFREKFDRILLDVPCSGLGTIQKHPDIKWRRSLTEIENFQILQTSLLKQAGTYLKPHGILVYSTCTVDRMENEDVVNMFIEQYGSEFEIVRADDQFHNFISEEKYLRTFPNIHKMDGAFCVRIRKRG